MNQEQSDPLVLSFKMAKEDSESQNTDSSGSPEREDDHHDHPLRRGSLTKSHHHKHSHHKRNGDDPITKKPKEAKHAQTDKKSKDKDTVALAKSGDVPFLDSRMRSPSHEAALAMERKVVSQKSSPNMNDNRKMKKQQAHQQLKSSDVEMTSPRKVATEPVHEKGEKGATRGRTKDDEVGKKSSHLGRALSPTFSRSGRENKKEALQKNKSAGSSIFKRKKSKNEEKEHKETDTKDKEKKPQEPIVQETKLYNGMEDFPVGIQKHIIALKLSKEEQEENWQLIKKITLFLFKEEFKKQKTLLARPPLKPQKSTFANHRMIEKGREVLKEQENLKKVFKTMMMLGSGGFGSVYVGKDFTQNKLRVAIKKLNHLEEKRKLTNFAEIGFLASCDHPNIVHYFSAWISSDAKKTSEIYLIVEYLQGGTLSQAVSSFQFGELQIAFLGREVLKAIQYLHQRNWAHRDLKSANIMLDINGNVKIIDFGLCTDMTDGPLTTMVGSPYWIPPEMIRGQPHHLPVDIWSFAVCLLELFLLTPPFHKSPLKCMYTVATEGLTQLIPKGASQEAKQVLERCLVQNPDNRATSEELLQMSFFQRPGIDKALAGVLRDIFMTNSLTSVM